MEKKDLHNRIKQLEASLQKKQNEIVRARQNASKTSLDNNEL